MSNVIPAPEKKILNNLVAQLKKLLDRQLVGVYLHGSLAMGCYQPKVSDIDFLVVVSRALPVAQKKKIGDIMIAASRNAPAKGLEMSVVTLRQTKHFQYPTPFELHFSQTYRKDYEQGRVDFTARRKDPDLAAHFVMTRARGVCLYGRPIESVFADVPRRYFLKSLAQDFADSFHQIMDARRQGKCLVPAYAVLNFCRTLAYLQENLLLSKAEGGAWALAHVPANYAPLIQEAMRAYAGKRTAHLVSTAVLKEFTRYVRQHLPAGLGKRN